MKQKNSLCQVGRPDCPRFTSRVGKNRRSLLAITLFDIYFVLREWEEFQNLKDNIKENHHHQGVNTIESAGIFCDVHRMTEWVFTLLLGLHYCHAQTPVLAVHSHLNCSVRFFFLLSLLSLLRNGFISSYAYHTVPCTNRSLSFTGSKSLRQDLLMQMISIII